MKAGIVYISFGIEAAETAKRSIDSIKKLGINIPIVSIGSTKVIGTDFIKWTGNNPWRNETLSPKLWFAAGEVKPHLYDLSPFEYTLYLDADTMIRKDLTLGFSFLDDYDICVANHYGDMRLKNVWKDPRYFSPEHSDKRAERDATIKLLGDENTPFINSGVIFFKKNYAVQQVFTDWYLEWIKYRAWDEQMALHRAIHKCPRIKVRYMPEIWNKKFEDDQTIIWHKMGGGSARNKPVKRKIR